MRLDTISVATPPRRHAAQHGAAARFGKYSNAYMAEVVKLQREHHNLLPAPNQHGFPTSISRTIDRLGQLQQKLDANPTTANPKDVAEFRRGCLALSQSMMAAQAYGEESRQATGMYVGRIPTGFGLIGEGATDDKIEEAIRASRNFELRPDTPFLAPTDMTIGLLPRIINPLVP